MRTGLRPLGLFRRAGDLLRGGGVRRRGGDRGRRGGLFRGLRDLRTGFLAAGGDDRLVVSVATAGLALGKGDVFFLAGVLAALLPLLLDPLELDDESLEELLLELELSELELRAFAGAIRFVEQSCLLIK